MKLNTEILLYSLLLIIISIAFINKSYFALFIIISLKISKGKYFKSL